MQAARLFRQILRPQTRRGYASKDIFPKTTMNELPQPQGSWQTHYDQNQRKHNRDLALGIIFTAVTLAYGQYMDFYRMYDDVPETPAKIDSYRQ